MKVEGLGWHRSNRDVAVQVGDLQAALGAAEQEAADKAAAADMLHEQAMDDLRQVGLRPALTKRYKVLFCPNINPVWTDVAQALTSMDFGSILQAVLGCADTNPLGLEYGTFICLYHDPW